MIGTHQRIEIWVQPIATAGNPFAASILIPTQFAIGNRASRRGACAHDLATCMKPSSVIHRLEGMNALDKHPIRIIFALLVAIPLVSCSSPGQPSQPTEVPAPTVNSTPTGEIEVLPTPTPSVFTEPTVPTPIETVSAESVPGADADWIQESYGDAWTIGYPTGWTVNAAGANEGALQLQGEYESRSYAVTYSYPIGILADSLDAWVDEALLALTLEQREAVVITDVTIANTPAKKVLNVPTPDGASIAHHLYIWRSETKKQRLITITQIDGLPVDPVAMEQLLDRLLVPVR